MFLPTCFSYNWIACQIIVVKFGFHSNYPFISGSHKDEDCIAAPSIMFRDSHLLQ